MISLLAGTAPAALGSFSVAGITNTTHAQEATSSGDVMTTGQNRSQQIETRIGTLEFTHDFANGIRPTRRSRSFTTSVIFSGPAKPISGRFRRSRLRHGSAASRMG
jgi:hypothetical protein